MNNLVTKKAVVSGSVDGNGVDKAIEYNYELDLTNVPEEQLINLFCAAWKVRHNAFVKRFKNQGRMEQWVREFNGDAMAIFAGTPVNTRNVAESAYRQALVDCGMFEPNQIDKMVADKYPPVQRSIPSNKNGHVKKLDEIQKADVIALAKNLKSQKLTGAEFDSAFIAQCELPKALQGIALEYAHGNVKGLGSRG